VITCEVCGTTNEPTLTFCRNCGNRLAGKRGRGVAPTPVAAPKATPAPPVDVPDSESDWALDPAQLGARGSGVPAPRHSRPSAPPLFLGKGKGDGEGNGERAPRAAARPRPMVAPGASRTVAGLGDDPPPARATAPARPSAKEARARAEAAGEEQPVPEAPRRERPTAGRPEPDRRGAQGVDCAQCGAQSPRGYRFCISCGAVLAKLAAAEAAEPPRAELRRGGAPPSVRTRPAPPPPRAEPPLEEPDVRAARVVEVAALEVAPARPSVECTRCGGACEAGESFCKYCGAPIGKRRTTAEAHAEARALEEQPTDADRSAPIALNRAAAAEAQRRRGTDRRGLAPRRALARLVVIVEDGSEGPVHDLASDQVDVGSRDGDIVLAEDRYLSARHARLSHRGDDWYLRDLGSLNRVYRRLRRPSPLRDGDLVLLGLEVLEFQLLDQSERGLSHAVQHGVLVFGSPAVTRRARLLQRTVEGVVRDVYHLVNDETTIGRETGDIVFSSDPFMSRRHSLIRYSEETQEFVLHDLNSSNGTYLAIREEIRLEDGDYVRLGQHLFRVDLPPRTS
jgi:pSer/pThr/pTyr-binding forkhead associated (FHA) protein